ncbi:hypothetical protein XVE_2366 [Xanthomonas vesicatoria ATCC 35937]|uniref:Uncharacterized protein n=1 Tax=Xanthomonas vesicatoria ATCC 35937 TaxID=925775 RepID=F0BDZ5_9XANT|nr:hypothetical protein XVE_4900 [Xanthomonas vesicatoria ATCC 35937]EGD09394.1 hypothetical protein XVE_2366 [Xanthomonas vesicatoria ATCC 35937]
MIMCTRQGIAGQYTQAAGHPQMQQRTTSGISIHQQILGTSTDLRNGGSGKQAFDLLGDGPTQVRPAQNHPVDTLPDQMRRKSAHGSFDFGQLRHQGIQK